MSALPHSWISPEEYLRIERAAEFKSEYFDGEMYAMSGGTLAHSRIPQYLTIALDAQITARGCHSCNSDMRVGITTRGPFVYPDLTIACGEPHLADDQNDVLLNPTVVFEVLSKSSEVYDRGQKFAQYRRISSLREYVLVSQHEPRIEVFSRDEDGKWSITEAAGLDSVFSLPSLKAEITLAAVYRNISLTPTQ